jgi:hypothetical protein
MSISDFTFPDKGFDTVRNPHPTLLSLNEIFKESLKKAQAAASQLQIIVRCEPLPHIRGNAQAIATLFDELLGIILKYPPSGSRLFLYLHCDVDHTSGSFSSELQQYVLKFHSNAGVPENWKIINSQALINCRQVLSEHNGTLVINHSGGRGCLFSVSLPGKIQ